MNPEKQNRLLWRETLGDDEAEVWAALAPTAAPPLRVPFEHDRGGRWRMAAAAAMVFAAVLAAWNVSLHRQLGSTRNDYAFAMLGVDSSPTQLTALSLLRDAPLSDRGVAVLSRIVATSRDPNVQLAALDLLLDSGIVEVDDVTRDLLDRIKHNRRFVETSLRARSAPI